MGPPPSARVTAQGSLLVLSASWVQTDAVNLSGRVAFLPYGMVYPPGGVRRPVGERPAAGAGPWLARPGGWVTAATQ